jgi:hypothetical protein
MQDLLNNQGFLMPLVWLVAALAAAMILYWTSKAFLDAEEMFGVPIKRLRLGGSVVIFALVFVILWKSTTSDAIVVQSSQMATLRAAVEDLENSLPMVEACHESKLPDSPQCEVAYAQHKAKVADLKAVIIKAPFAPPSD